MLDSDRTRLPALHVLVPGGRDMPCDYSGGVPDPSDCDHPPVNFHAMAAATRGCFSTRADAPELAGGNVLLLLGRRLGRGLDAMAALRSRGCRTWITWKECGDHQIAGAMRGWFAEQRVARLLEAAAGVITASSAAHRFFARRCDAVKLHGLFTPYPVGEAAWDFSNSLDQRVGIWIGTREPHVPSRRHDEAVDLALDLAHARGTHVSVVNAGGASGARHHLKLAGPRACALHILDGPLPYPDYLRAMARHRIVLQRDASHVPGQVAGDALLARMPCLGGNGLVDLLVHSEAAPISEDVAALRDRAAFLMDDDRAWQDWVAEQDKRAREKIGYTAFRSAWARVLG